MNMFTKQDILTLNIYIDMDFTYHSIGSCEVSTYEWLKYVDDLARSIISCINGNHFKLTKAFPSKKSYTYYIRFKPTNETGKISHKEFQFRLQLRESTSNKVPIFYLEDTEYISRIKLIRTINDLLKEMQADNCGTKVELSTKKYIWVNKEVILNRLLDKTDTIIFDIIKCVICRDTLLKSSILSDWIPEIAAIISEASGYTWGEDKKLKPRDYIRTLFGSFGTTVEDSKINLKEFSSHKGEDFDIYQQYLVVDDNTAKIVRDICDDILATFPKLLSNKRSYKKKEVIPLLTEIFMSYK